jgi:hypothetical protein
MYEEYLEEKVDYNKPLEPQLAAAREKLRTAQATRNAPAKPAPQLRGLSVGKGGFNINNKPVNPGMSSIFQRPGQPNPKPVATNPPAPKPSATNPPVRPSTAPARPSAAPAAKTAPAKPAGSAMDQWRAANPKLAAAADEKARIRGTQQTDNPLMKDMRSRLPMNSPSVQSPAVSNLGKGNQSLSQNPNAFKAATPTKAIAAAPSTSAAASGSVAPVTAKLAATPKPTPVAPRQTARERVLSQSYEYDAFDLVLEYLIDNGHVDTVDEALYVMMEMDSEVIQDIVSESGYFPTPESQRADEAKYRKMRSAAPPVAKTKERFIPGDDRMPGQPARPTTIPGK